MNKEKTLRAIAVMQAFERGEKIEYCFLYESGQTGPWHLCDAPHWGWDTFSYRVVPAAPKTVKKKVKIILQADGEIGIVRDDSTLESVNNIYKHCKVSPAVAISTVEVEFVVDGGSEEKVSIAGKAGISKEAWNAPQTLDPEVDMDALRKAYEESRQEDGSPQLEVERLKYVAEKLAAELLNYSTALKFISQFGGKQMDGISCNGSWAAEQARSSLNQKDWESLRDQTDKSDTTAVSTPTPSSSETLHDHSPSNLPSPKVREGAGYIEEGSLDGRASSSLSQLRVENKKLGEQVRRLTEALEAKGKDLETNLFVRMNKVTKGMPTPP